MTKEFKQIDDLPKWVPSEVVPHLFDLESLTNIEMIHRMRTIINDVCKQSNDFVEYVVDYINAYRIEDIHDMSHFRKHIDQIVADYIKLMDKKLETQDIAVKDVIAKIQTEALQYVMTLLPDGTMLPYVLEVYIEENASGVPKWTCDNIEYQAIINAWRSGRRIVAHINGSKDGKYTPEYGLNAYFELTTLKEEAELCSLSFFTTAVSTFMYALAMSIQIKPTGELQNLLVKKLSTTFVDITINTK